MDSTVILDALVPIMTWGCTLFLVYGLSLVVDSELDAFDEERGSLSDSDAHRAQAVAAVRAT